MRVSRTAHRYGDKPHLVQCLLHAWQNCTPARLTLSAYGIDAGSVDTFLIRSGATSCQISVTISGTGMARNQHSQYTCASIAPDGAGAVIRQCPPDSGEFHIPDNS